MAGSYKVFFKNHTEIYCFMKYPLYIYIVIFFFNLVALHINITSKDCKNLSRDIQRESKLGAFSSHFV